MKTTLTTSNHIANIERAIRQKRPLDKHIIKLRKLGLINTLINCGLEDKHTLLTYFILQNNYQKIENLLSGDNAADPLLVNEAGETPLFLAVISMCCRPSFDIRIIDLLLNYSPEQQVLQQDKFGRTLLYIATFWKNVILIKKLIVVNEKKQLLTVSTVEGASGATPLLYAVRENLPVEIIEALLSVWPDEQVLIPDANGNIPLNHAFQKANLDAINILTQHSREQQFAHVDNDGLRLLHSLALSGNIAFARNIINTFKPNDYLVQSKAGMTPLVLAIIQKHTEIALIFLEFGPLEQLYIACNGNLPIHCAADCNLIKVMHAIIERDKNQLECTEHHGRTPLHRAVNSNNLLAATFLLRRGANKLAKDVDLRGPIHYACSSGFLDICRLLLTDLIEDQLFSEDGLGYNPFHLAAISDRKEIVKYVLSVANGINKALQCELLNSQENTGFSAMHIACSEVALEKVELLASYAPDVNVQTEEGWTPLHYASSRGNLIIVRRIVELGGSLDMATHNGYTPLHIASANGHVKVVEYLLEVKSSSFNVDQKDRYNCSSLFTATAFGHSHVITLLANSGANLNDLVTTDSEEITPLIVAIDLRDLKTVKLLIQLGANPHQKLKRKINNDFMEYSAVERIQSWRNQVVASHFLKAMKIERTVPTYEASCVASDQSISSSSSMNTVNEKLSSYSYLKKLGFSKEQLKDFEEERKLAKAKLMSSPSLFFTEPKEVRIFTWLNNLFDSTHPEVHIIHYEKNTYIYLDRATLTQQGCPFEETEGIRFKFGGTHIKMLDTSKGQYTDYIHLPTEDRVKKVIYTHELKINKVDRVLLFSLNADDQKGCLFVGSRYVQGGFHSKYKSRAVKRSGESRQNGIEIHWPNGLIPQRGNLI